MKNFMLFLMTLFLSCHVMAQQTTVTGTITDGTDGSPLIGANVLVKGTGTGSIADVDVYKRQLCGDAFFAHSL